MALSWLAPNHYPPWTSFHGETAAFGALVLLALTTLLREEPRHWRLPLLVGAAAVAGLGVQWHAGLIAYRGDAALSGLYFVGAVWAWWAGRSAPAGARRGDSDGLTFLAFALLAGALVSVIVGLLQWNRLETLVGIFAADRGPDMRVFANLGQPNHFATLCATAAVLAMWLGCSKRMAAWQLGATLVAMAAGVTMSESRAGLLGAVAAGALIVVCARTPVMRRTVWPWVGLWWTLLAFLAAAWPVLNEALFLQSARSGQFAGDGARATMWRQCVAAIMEHPWAGYGWRQTLFAQKQAALQVPGSLATEYAHNALLDLALWIGIPGAILLLGLACTWSLRSLRRIGSERELFLCAALVPFLVHAMFEFPFAYMYFLVPIAWMCGHLARVQAPPPAHVACAGTGTLKRWWGLALLAAYAALALQIGREYLAAEEDYRVMRFELRRVGRVPAGYSSPDLPVLTQLDSLLKVGRMAPRPNMSDEDLQSLRVASERNNWATLDVGFAVALALNGKSADARRQLSIVKAVYGPATAAHAEQYLHEFRKQYPDLERLRFE